MANNTGLNATDITSKWNLFLDVVAAAVMCDRTRVITIGVHKALGPGPDSGQHARWSATTTRRTPAAAPGTAWRTTGRTRTRAGC